MPLEGSRPWRAGVAGLAIVATYLATSALSMSSHLVAGSPVLDDGPLIIQPYDWVTPPKDRLRDNKPATGTTAGVPLTALGSGGSVATADGQAQFLLDSTSVPQLPGQTSVSVTIQPLDPATVARPPLGLRYDSNAYRIDATYQPSNMPVENVTATVVLTYATAANAIVRWNGTGWDKLPSTVAGQNQLFAPAAKLGIFAAAGSGTATAPRNASPLLLVLEFAGPFALIALALVVFLGRQRRPSR